MAVHSLGERVYRPAVRHNDDDYHKNRNVARIMIILISSVDAVMTRERERQKERKKERKVLASVLHSE
jgi:hypothetical protein